MFNKIITDKEFFGTIPDCIFEGKDYEEHFQDAFQLTNGLLQMEAFAASTSEDEEHFNFVLIVSGREEKMSVRISSDYIHGEDFVNGLNAILKNAAYAGEKQFCDLSGNEIDFGIAFISRDKEQQLAEQDLIWRPYGYFL